MAEEGTKPDQTILIGEAPNLYVVKPGAGAPEKFEHKPEEDIATRYQTLLLGKLGRERAGNNPNELLKVTGAAEALKEILINTYHRPDLVQSAEEEVQRSIALDKDRRPSVG